MGKDEREHVEWRGEWWEECVWWGGRREGGRKECVGGRKEGHRHGQPLNQEQPNDV